MDIETAHAKEAPTPLRRAMAVLVGTAALFASLLGLMQLDAGKRQERALLLAGRLSVEAFQKIAAGGIHSSFELVNSQRAIALSIQGTARQIAAFDHPDLQSVQTAMGQADVDAGTRMVDVAAAMARVEAGASGLDPATESSVLAEPDEILALVQEQNRQVDLADRFSLRGDRAVVGLSMVAIAAVLLGLAGVVGESRSGTISVIAAAGALVAGAAGGIAALLA